jgi:hypothetical protein
MMAMPAVKLTYRGQVNQQQEKTVMGDKSPKANQKKSGQKQSKANSAAANKNASVAAKQAAAKKR